MKSEELKTLCDVMCSGNVTKFVALMGITRTSYYRSITAAGDVHELTAHRVQRALHDMLEGHDVNRLSLIETRLDALEGKL